MGSFIILCGSFSIIVLTLFTVVEGLYIVQTQIHGYDNPTQWRFLICGNSQCFGAGGCCDIGEGNCTSGERRCDTFFIFCLRPLGISPRLIGCGSNTSSVIQSDVNMNDAAINFSRSSFLGLNNPFTLPGLTNSWNGVQLLIHVRDKDGENDSQYIATFVVNIEQPVNLSQRRVSRGAPIALNISITVFCIQNFQGPDCAECIPGFTGVMCDENIDDCVGIMCSGNGQCVDGLNSFICDCDPGYTGVECEDNINECVDPGVNCSGNGKCVDVFGSYHCNCSAGYNGTDCEIDIDDCVGIDCSGHGVCVDSLNSFNCQCSPGYSGTLCSEVVEVRGSKLLIPTVGGAVGGVLVTVTFLVIITIIVVIIVIAEYKTRSEIKPDALANLKDKDIEMKKNEVYGASMAFLEAGQQPGIPDDTLMSRNVCYATTQHIEIVDNECYGSVPEK